MFLFFKHVETGGWLDPAGKEHPVAVNLVAAKQIDLWLKLVLTSTF